MFAITKPSRRHVFRRLSKRERVRFFLLIGLFCIFALTTRTRTAHGEQRQHEIKERFLARFDHGPRPGESITAVESRHARRNRVYISSIPVNVGDGLGHRFAMLNLEMEISAILGIGYVHRRGRYGSLSPRDDANAVERLFGWLSGVELRSDVLAHSCADIEYVSDQCKPKKAVNPVCRKLRPRNDGGQFDYLVMIPAAIIDCFIYPKDVRECHRAAAAFMARHTQPDTLFQMTPRRCFRDYRDGNYSATGGFLRARYWGFHGRYGAAARPPPPPVPAGGLLPGRSRSRALSLDPRRLQVAVHIRRGDFMNFTERQTVPDTVYADVVCEVKRAVDERLRAPAPLDVHVYSEGVVRNGRVKNNHDTATMMPLYVNERGEIKDSEHWPSLIRARMRLQQGNTTGLEVHQHFASDTAQAVHDMMAADFFVGSQSGLSGHIVVNFARGVVILPDKPDKDITSGTRKWYLRYGYTTRDQVGIVRRDKLRMRVDQLLDPFTESGTVLGLSRA